MAGVEVGANGSGVGLGEGAIVEGGLGERMTGIDAPADAVGGKAGVRVVENTPTMNANVAMNNTPAAGRRNDVVHPVGLR